MHMLIMKSARLHKSQIFLMTLSLSVSTLGFAGIKQSFQSGYNVVSSGRPVISLGAGPVQTPGIGQSTNFPVINPLTDSFYTYTDTSKAQVKAAFNGFLGGEWVLYPKWFLQVGLGFNQAQNLTAKGSLLQGADLQSADQYSYQYSVLTRQVVVESKLLYHYKNHFFPYAVLGLGTAINKAYGYSTTVPPFLTFTRMYNNKTQTSFSYLIGAGVDMDITPHLRLGMGYRFADLGKAQLGSAIIDTIPVAGTLSKNHIYANEVIAQATWLI